jgi:fatty acid desaturase
LGISYDKAKTLSFFLTRSYCRQLFLYIEELIPARQDQASGRKTEGAFGFWKELLLLWLVPYLTVFNLLLHVRSIAEHFATENDDPLNITRTTIIPAWEKIFFPKNINYHLEHHLYPAVPFYRLPALHRELMGQPTYRQKAHVTYSYFGVLRECLRLNGFKRTCLPDRPSRS